MLSPLKREAIRSRMTTRLMSAEEQDDGCLVLTKGPQGRKFEVVGPCNLNCGNKYHRASSRYKNSSGSPGHKVGLRFGLLIKMFEVFDEAAQAALWDFVKLMRGPEGSLSHEVSHYCRCRTDILCVETTHFDMEPRWKNLRRTKHQAGNALCNCASTGDKPCIINPKIGEKIFDEEGNHIGWERKDKHYMSMPDIGDKVFDEEGNHVGWERRGNGKKAAR